MSGFSKKLLVQVQTQIEILHTKNSTPIEYCSCAITILKTALDKLKVYYSSHTFSDQTEEIVFFKSIKPQFLYRLIYYSEIYTIQISKPYGSEKVLRKYYIRNLNRLKNFYDSNTDFYRYYRSGNNSLDSRYFVRGQINSLIIHDYFYIQEDRNFTTTYDFKVAQIMANDLLQLYLENEIGKLSPMNDVRIADKVNCPQKWTASKVALVELIYALHAYGVFNNGASDLKDVASFFEKTLQIDLGQFHRTFLEIRMRKSERTKFLSALCNCVVKRMEKADG
ncbi:MAG: RteC domain-containing protein [Candidatus Saccharimonadaceae bacterium]